MKNIVLPVCIVMAMGMPVLAADTDDIRSQFIEEFRAKHDIMWRVGVDALGGNDDTEALATGGKKGLDRGMGFEVSVGAEEKAENFSWGSRRLMTFYSHGSASYYNDTYKADISNIGVETTAASYYKMTQYVKPYIGIGLGININSYDDNGASVKSQHFQPTVHAVGGVSGELIAGLGYYAEYKYRFSNSVEQELTLKDGSHVSAENTGVNGGVFMAGVSYQF